MIGQRWRSAATAALLVLALLAGAGGAAAAAPSGCVGCHKDFASVLPKGHAPVKGTTLAACAGCHKPLASNADAKPQRNAYASAMHRAHAKADGGVDCAVCHVANAKGRPGVVNGKVVLVATTAELADLAKAMTSPGQAQFTAGLHGKANVSCGGCHATLPKVGDEVANERCLACHGPEEELQRKTEPAQFKDRNPHKSHLGEIACTVCHKGHEAAVVYCKDCHKKFEMTIVGAGS